MTPDDTSTAPTPSPERVDVHPAVKLWRTAMFLSGEEGMDADQWFARLTHSEPGRRYFGRTCSQLPEYHDKLWDECSPDLKRFHASQEFMHDTGMWREEAALARPDAAAEGFVLAPREPTEEMLEAFCDANRAESEAIRREGYRPDPGMLAKPCYRAMIAAAPQPPAPEVAAEPVAWRVNYDEVTRRGWGYMEVEPALGYFHTVEPLYAAPQPVGPASGDAVREAEAALTEMIRLADMSYDEAMKEPEENGCYVAYTRIKAARNTLRAALAQTEPSPAPAENGEG